MVPAGWLKAHEDDAVLSVSDDCCRKKWEAFAPAYPMFSAI